MQPRGTTREEAAQPDNQNGIRYTSLAFLAVLIGITLLNTYLSKSLQVELQSIELSARQQVLTQSITKDIFYLKDNRSAENEFFDQALERLDESSSVFDKTLQGLINGGETTDAAGEVVNIDKIKGKKNLEKLIEASKLWNGLNEKINTYLAVPSGPVFIDEIALEANKQNLQLSSLMKQTTANLTKDATRKSNLLSIISLLALIITIIYFGYIIFYSISKIRQRDEEVSLYARSLQSNNSNLERANISFSEMQHNLEHTLGNLQISKNEAELKSRELQAMTDDLARLQEESDKIFSSVDHGLCLLTPDYNIGNRLSQATLSIFEREHLAGLSFIDLMEPLISDKDLDTLKTFLKLQFEGKTLSSQLEKFNPLKSIEMTLNWDGNSFSNKHVGFEFERIINNNRVEQVLVTITDITDNIVLQRNLEKAEKDQEHKTQLISELLNVDPEDFTKVLIDTEEGIDEINIILQENNIARGAEIPAESRIKIVGEVSRKIHSIKGNASIVGLKRLVDASHSVESQLSALQSETSISGDALLGALVNLSTLKELVNEYREIKDALLTSFTVNPEVKQTKTKEDALSKQLIDFTSKIASDVGKKVHMVTDFQFDQINEEKLDKVKDIFIQLIRNSVIHGIEAPEERLDQGKLEEGMLYVSVKPKEEGEGVKFTFRDDGRGLDIAKIKRKALGLGLLKLDDPNVDNESYLAKMIFSPNLSTQDKITDHAGRGVGMDVIKNTIVNDLNGKLSMSYSDSRYTEFSWVTS